MKPRRPAPGASLRSLDTAALARVRGGLDTAPVAQTSGVWDPARAVMPSVAPSSASALPSSPALLPPVASTPVANPHAQSPAPSLSPSAVADATSVLGSAVQGLPPAKVEEMITLYHISNNPGWAAEIAKGKADNKHLEELRRPISPDITKNNRKADVYGDGRGGDDLGPGFYTGNSASFVEKYASNYDKNNPASVLEFTLPKSALEALNARNIDKGDNDSFQQYMKDGFASYNSDTKQTAHPKLDKEAPAFDLLSGPINDIEAASKLGPRIEGNTSYSQGSILTLPSGEVPLQYAFATQQGVKALYENASIKSTEVGEWMKQRTAAKEAT